MPGARTGGEPPGARGAPPTASRCTLNSLEGAWDAPPLNRPEVSIKVLRLYIFAMRLQVLKYIACQVPLDKPLKR